jgi:hypothetical protein
MREIGLRRVPDLIAAEPSGAWLVTAARHSETLARLGPCPIMLKGVYRYDSHAEMNRHADNALAAAMARLATLRRPD